MIDELIDIIGREAALFERFLHLLEEQQAALEKHDREALGRITDRQQHMFLESRRLNADRERVLARINRENLVDGDVTVIRLLATVDEDRADRLAELRETILGLNERIRRVRIQNTTMLNRSREYIRKTMELLARIATPTAGVYAGTGGGCLMDDGSRTTVQK